MEKKRTLKNDTPLTWFTESLMENREIWISAYDFEGNVTLWNLAAEIISGYTREEVEGDLKIWKWLYPDDEYRKNLKKTLNEKVQVGKVAVDNITVIHCKRGKTKIISWNNHVLYDEEKQSKGMICVGRDITRQSRMETRLRENMDRYRTLFESAGLAVVILKNKKIFACNAKTLELFRAKWEKISGTYIHTLSPTQQPDGQNSDEKGAAILEKIREGEPQCYEWHFSRLDGSQFLAEVMLTPLKLETGNYAQCVIQDITQRKRYEEELKVERDLNKNLIDTSPAFIVAIDLEGKVMLMNEAMLKTLGYSKEEVVGTDYLEKFVPPEEHGNFEVVFKDQTGERKRTLNENYVIAKDGRQLLVEWHGRPVFNAEGEVDSFFGVGVDISERKIAAEALKQSELRFRQMAQLLPQTVWETDLKGNLIYANLEAFKAFKYNTWDFEQGLNVMDLIVEEDRPRAKRNFERTLEGEERGGAEFTALRKDGTTFPFVIYSNAISYGETVVGIRGIAVDISVQKEAEENEKKYMQQLMQADKMISLGTLVSGVAHEINNPNNAIMFNVPMLEEIFDDIKPLVREQMWKDGGFTAGGIPGDQLEETVRQLLNGMERSAERIKTIVEDLKNFSRQEPVQTNQVVQVNEVVKSSVTLLNNMINKSTRLFSVQYGDDVPPIKGNFQRLEQVIINLIQNACQALRDKENEIQVTTAFDDRKKIVKISVRDEGKGIPKKDIKYVTDPFYTTKRDVGGTGLGLSISNRIIEDHGGRLKITSRIDCGSTFTVEIPAFTGTGK
jgi:PAS domain S-box-containing protein